MVTYDDDEEDQGPIVVRRPVYEAGIKLEAEEDAGRIQSFVEADARMEEARTAGKTDESAFWKEVYNFCMTRESVAADTEVVILEEGERYDFETGKVIRS